MTRVSALSALGRIVGHTQRAKLDRVEPVGVRGLSLLGGQCDTLRPQLDRLEIIGVGTWALLETNPAALDRVVFVAGRAVDAARQQREAAVQQARARVRAARAAGWPTPELVGDTR